VPEPAVPAELLTPTPAPLRFPDVRQYPVAGGELVEAYLPDAEMAAVLLLIQPGALAEPRPDGTLGLTLRMLREGPAGIDPAEFALTLDSLGARWLGELDWDAVKVGLSVPAEHLGAALRLLNLTVREPAFRAEDLDRVRRQRIAADQAEQRLPGASSLAAIEAALAPGSRLGRPREGSADSLARITMADVRAMHEQLLESRRTVIIAAGRTAVLPAEMVPAGLAGDGPVAGAAAMPASAVPARHILVPASGSVATVRLGHAAPARSSPDLLPLRLLETILGGSAAARFDRRLRDQRGLTYRTSASFDFRRDSGTFRVSCQVPSGRGSEAVTELRTEMRILIEGGLTEREVDRVRRYRTGLLATQFETPEVVALGLATIALHELPSDYFKQVHAGYLAVSAAEIAAAARRHLRPDALVVAVEDAPYNLSGSPGCS
jgi:zinc protease